MDYDLAAFLVLAMAILAIGLVLGRRSRIIPQSLMMLALLLRIVGCLARYEVLMRFYGGVGDASGYYGTGLRMAERFWSGDLTLLSPNTWLAGRP